ncbi:hypothetical protein [Bacillus cereus]|uniref:hypothetical protein n=1 Tax=Bacillus cereus TaxID=1396 RepID=UPI0015969F0F|nr:hypothetical protein [Bacillus cereus]
MCVDHVLKCSIECLPQYEMNCHNVVVSDFKVTPLQKHGWMLPFTGTVEFKHIPHE